MAKETNGVFQNKDNSWGFRFTAVIDGKQITKRKTKDENGQKFPTRKAAAKASGASTTIGTTTYSEKMTVSTSEVQGDGYTTKTEITNHYK